MPSPRIKHSPGDQVPAIDGHPFFRADRTNSSIEEMESVEGILSLDEAEKKQSDKGSFIARANNAKGEGTKLTYSTGPYQCRADLAIYNSAQGR